MKPDVKIALTLLAGLVTLFATTLLLDLAWINAQPVRQVLVYIVMALEILLFANNVWALLPRSNDKP